MSRRTRVLFSEPLPVVLAALAFAACGGGGAPLVTLTDVAPGDECANGGFIIAVGDDEDGDGVLSAAETTSSETVCHPADGQPGQAGDDGAHGTVTRTTVLPIGDPDCPHGGLRLDAGPDDGSGGGTAGDGVLQTGEIASTETVCNGAPAVAVSSMEPPAGPAGAFTMDLSGGEGTGFYGGTGGSFEAFFDHGPGGGGVRVFRTGEAVSPLTFPTTLTAYLGREPLVVTTDTVVQLAPDTGTLLDGDLYVVGAPAALYRWDATAVTGVAITGIQVAQGATLTLPLNDGMLELQLENDFHLAGTLTTVASPLTEIELLLEVGNWIGESSGRVELTGALSPLKRSFGVFADTDVPGIQQGAGAVFNRSTIDLTGVADDTTGGAGGDATLYGNVVMYNAGPILAAGASDVGTSGRGGGDVELGVGFGPLFNSGDIDVRGGDGSEQGGGGGSFRLVQDRMGWVVNTGDVDLRGGSTPPCGAAASCYGGSAGAFEARFDVGGFVNTGTIDGRGGDAPLGAGAFSRGGAGGAVDIRAQDTDSGWWGGEAVPRSLHMSGDLLLGGGGGHWGGNGGSVKVEHDLYEVAQAQDITFLGYPSLDLSGGAGATGGGSGGQFAMYTDYGYLGWSYVPGGYLLNHADVDLSGGSATVSGFGGQGGSVGISTYNHLYASYVVANNYGDLSTVGGDGVSGAGGGGDVWIVSLAGIVNGGAIDASGGSGSSGSGGAAAGIHLLTDDGVLHNTGVLRSSGGQGPLSNGGSGSTIELVGGEVHNTASLFANGGDGASTDAYVGGAGGYLFLHSLWGTTTQTATTLEASGGAAAVDGHDGQVFIDGMNVTSLWLP